MSAKETSALDLPSIDLELLEDRSPAQPVGFLRLERHAFRARYPDGSVSREFEYDSVTRKALDAVVLVAHYEQAGQSFVYLRSALRPPLALAALVDRPHGGLWELPAGLIEPHEQTRAGIEQAARRELLEELGFTQGSLAPLGPWTFPCPGVLAERQFYFRILVDPSERCEPTLDGSPLEAGGFVRALPLVQALELCRRGDIVDAKTELGLRRLLEFHS